MKRIIVSGAGHGGICAAMNLGKNGYAVLGDAASMTEPLCGSGIALSVSAGRILSEVIIKNTPESFDVKDLWEYQYRYYKEYGEDRLYHYILKRFLSKLNYRQIDYLMEKGIMNSDDISRNTESTKNQFLVNLKKGFFVTVNPSLWKWVFREFLKVTKINRIRKALPKEYNEEKIKKWQKLYSKI